MEVKISNYVDIDDKKFIEYKVFNLLKNQIEYLKNNLDDEMTVNEDILTLTIYFDEKLYPFQSDVAKIRLDDFIAREEIEMNLFLSAFLEDMILSKNKM